MWVVQASDAAASGGESTSALYRETFAILHPEVLKLRDLMAFCNSLNDTFTDCVKVRPHTLTRHGAGAKGRRRRVLRLGVAGG